MDAELTSDAPGGDAVLVFTTLANDTDARLLVRDLVDARIVACGTIITGSTSIYRWKSEVVEEGEVLVILKTTADRWDDLAARVNSRHPYDVPELLAIPVAAGLPPYLEWVRNETTERESQSNE